MTIEGLVIQVIPQKERDLIARMLLREGTLVSIYVYGGMGGGKNAKPRKYEPGNLMRVQLTRHRSGHLAQDTLKTAAESSVLWQPQHIRHDAQGFALACLYLELVLKSALPMQDNQHGLPSEHAGLFNVLSNGLFFLDQALKVQRFEWSSHFTLFMSKFLLHLGILPDESVCVYCGAELANEFQTPLVIEQGGYACASCVGQLNGKMENISLRPYLAQAVRLKYQDWTQMQASHREICTRLIEFWGYHFQVRLPELTSYRLLF